jgi:hypothetical protein
MRRRPRRSTSKQDYIRRSKCKGLLLQLKKQSHCFCCSLNDWRVLDFHHRQSKSFGLASAIRGRRSAQVVVAEVRKCFVLCAASVISNVGFKLFYNNNITANPTLLKKVAVENKQGGERRDYFDFSKTNQYE